MIRMALGFAVRRGLAAAVHHWWRRSHRRVGLGGKLNPNCEMWTAAIATFGEGSMLHTSLPAIVGCAGAISRLSFAFVDPPERGG